MFVRLRIVFVCSLGWLKPPLIEGKEIRTKQKKQKKQNKTIGPTLMEGNFCSRKTCDKQDTVIAKLVNDNKNFQKELVELRELIQKVQKLEENVEDVQKDVSQLKCFSNFPEGESTNDQIGSLREVIDNICEGYDGELIQKVQKLEENVEDVQKDVSQLNGRVSGLCDWGDKNDEGNECRILRIGDYDISYDGEDNCLTTHNSGQEISTVCHEQDTKRSFFTFTTGYGSEEDVNKSDKRFFHLNPYDAQVSISNFPEGESTNDQIGSLREVIDNICEGYDGESCTSIKIGESFQIENYFDECLQIRHKGPHKDRNIYETCLGSDSTSHTFFLDADNYDGKHFNMDKNSKKVISAGWPTAS